MGHSKKVLKRGDTQKSETLKKVLKRAKTLKSAFESKFTLLSAQKSGTYIQTVQNNDGQLTIPMVYWQSNIYILDNIMATHKEGFSFK